MHYTPRLTIVAQMAEQIGRTAFDMLLSKMQSVDGEIRRPDSVLVPTELRVRDSTCPPAARHKAANGSPEPKN
jgi:DNA-binding LacI/PurR family transcriptional regulator